MAIEENKVSVRRIFEELFNQGNMTVADELVATDLIEHTPHDASAAGPEIVKQTVAFCHTTLPDAIFTVEDMVAEGDIITARITWSGIHKQDLFGFPPTGRHITQMQMHQFRFAHGKMVEHWVVRDDVGLMQQLGAVPPQEAVSSEAVVRGQ